MLADEINRAPAKVQSALLEAMQERQVTIGRETHPLPEPFLVMATQNPIESEGTYPLPEAQVDRFMLKVLVDYPTPDGGVRDRRADDRRARARADGSIDAAQLVGLQRAADEVFVDPALIEYAVKLANATRNVAAVGLGDLVALHHLRCEPARVDQPDPRGPGARARPRPRVRPAAGRPRDRPRRPAPPPRAVVRGARRRRHRRTTIIDRILAAVPVPEIVLRERMATHGTAPTPSETWLPLAQ